jgi:hypothetical protein
MGAGTAPFTGAGLLGALGNAYSAVTGFGLQNPVQMAARTAIAAIKGQPLANATFGLRDIPGQTPFDQDLMEKVASGVYVNGHRYGIGDAAQEQAHRNAINQSIAANQGRLVGHTMGGGGGNYNGGATANPGGNYAGGYGDKAHMGGY